MIDFMTTQKMTDRSVVVSCLLGSRLRGTGLPGVALRGNERPAKALAVAAGAAAEAERYASDFAVASAGVGSQKTQIQTQTQHEHAMWAFRGLNPWRDPA